MTVEPTAPSPELIAIDPKILREVETSYGRCLLKDGFLNRFYEIFITSHPDIRPMFAHTDFSAQIGLLRHGLNSVFMFSENNPIARKTLTRIRSSHSKDKLNIAPSLYRYWIDSLIKTVSEFDPEFTSDIEQAWRCVIQPAVDYITSGYTASSARAA